VPSISFREPTAVSLSDAARTFRLRVKLRRTAVASAEAVTVRESDADAVVARAGTSRSSVAAAIRIATRMTVDRILTLSDSD
jgi:hypothetical protein